MVHCFIFSYCFSPNLILYYFSVLFKALLEHLQELQEEITDLEADLLECLDD